MDIGKEAVPRIAASSYLNTAPLVWSFIHGSRRGTVDLITDTAPARCADMLARARVQAALVPVIEYQRIPHLVVAPGVCVGSRSRVRSVVLVTRASVDGLRDVRSVALDTSSRTSAALVKIVFREFLGVEPEWTNSAPDISLMLERNDAALIIGDPGISFPRERVVVYDLAELWRRHTGLGFVFAMWMAREDEVESVRRVDFAGARDEGLAHVEEIVPLYADAVGLSPGEIRSYLLENISFGMDEELRAGLDLYFRLAHKHGIVTEARPLKMLGA
ncbi:MAG TPA: menaquinone biosynthesis protein [Pyrinomonadaceae bacterium]|nr:menaquinone biosynthesis protein [Pyrinomonadaceae bacterium]